MRPVWPQRASHCSSSIPEIFSDSAFLAVRVMFAEPKEELPIHGREQFLLVRRAGRDFDQFANGAMPLARARAEQIEMDFERVKLGMIVRRARLRRRRAASRAGRPDAPARAGTSSSPNP